MSSFEIPTKAIPGIASAMGYRKKKARLFAQDAVTLTNLHWDSGSRSTYHAMNVATGQLTAAKYNPMNPPWSCPVEGATVQIPPGCVVIQSGIFMGKQATLYIYARRDEFAALLENLNAKATA